MTSADALLALTIIGGLAWLAAALALLLSHPRLRPTTGAETMDLGPEPPAVAALLAAPDVAPATLATATLYDLVARGAADLDVDATTGLVCRVTASSAPAASLRPFEVHVLDLVRRLAIGGAVPAAALTPGPPAVTRRWLDELRRSVEAAAGADGLVRPRFPAAAMVALGAGAGVLVLPLVFALQDPVGSPLGLVAGAVVSFTAVLLAEAALVVASLRPVPTPAGAEAASRWLGVRAHLAHGGFGSTDPRAVVVWDRYLAYAVALGIAGAAAAAFPFGAEDDEHAWSSTGGRWRRVRVVYPRLRPGWGRRWWVAAVHGTVGAAFGAVAVEIGRGIRRVDVAVVVGDTVDLVDVLGLVVGVTGLVMAGWSVVELVLALADGGRYRTVDGVVLRARRRQAQPFGPATGGSRRSRTRERFFLAVDDGSRDRVAAHLVSPALYRRVRQGERVRAEVSGALGHVRSVEVLGRVGPPPGPSGGEDLVLPAAVEAMLPPSVRELLRRRA